MDDAAPPACCWMLHAESDAQLPARVLACFTVCNELPTFFCMRQESPDRVRIEIRARVRDDGAARRLALRLRSIPTVIELGWSFCGGPMTSF